jgi:diguanylate cyclase (GGDEF)-like protein
MTDGGTKAAVAVVRSWLFTVNGIVAAVVVLALIIGLFLGSPVGRIICGLFLLAGLVAAAVVWRKQRNIFRRGDREDTEELYSQSPEGPMKKLLFDDFQSRGGQYVVKEIEEEGVVKPSSKSVQVVPITMREEKAKEFQISDFFDLDSDIFRNDTEPKSEFNFLLHKALLALKDVVFAHSAAFFWSNREKQQMVLETQATESQNFMAAKRFDVEDDVISHVARTGKPQLLGRINPVSEKELIRYYESPEYIKSVIAVPVFFFKGEGDQLPVGVIVADSKAEDAFGAETMGMLGNFTKLVSALIKSYTDKYDLLLDSELLTSIRRMHDRIKSDPTEFTILNSLAEETNRLINWDFLTVAMYSDGQRGWILQKVVNRSGQPYVSPDQMVDFNASVVGSVIRANNIERIDDLGAEAPVRFHPDEPIDHQGTFLCIPISSMNRCYGALSLESRTPANFSGNEVETVYRLVESAAMALEVLYMNDLVKDFVIVDQLTGSFNKKHFLKKLEEEVQRAEDFGDDLALVSIALDAVQEHINRYGREGLDAIVNTVAKTIRANIRPYDVVGRQEGDGIGVLLANTAASDAYLWAEKIRKQIASNIISLGNKSFSVTVSAGVCGLGEGMHKEELISGTSQVLNKAMENGGNLVRVF